MKSLEISWHFFIGFQEVLIDFVEKGRDNAVKWKQKESR